MIIIQHYPSWKSLLPIISNCIPTNIHHHNFASRIHHYPSLSHHNATMFGHHPIKYHVLYPSWSHYTSILPPFLLVKSPFFSEFQLRGPSGHQPRTRHIQAMEETTPVSFVQENGPGSQGLRKVVVFLEISLDLMVISLDFNTKNGDFTGF